MGSSTGLSQGAPNGKKTSVRLLVALKRCSCWEKYKLVKSERPWETHRRVPGKREQHLPGALKTGSRERELVSVFQIALRREE